MKIKRQTASPPTPSILVIAKANNPEKIPDNAPRCSTKRFGLASCVADTTEKPNRVLQGKSPAAESVDQQTLTGHDSSVLTITMSPDGNKVASGAHDYTVRLWDAATGTHLHTLKGHEAGVPTIAFSPDCRTLASTSSFITVAL